MFSCLKLPFVLFNIDLLYVNNKTFDIYTVNSREEGLLFYLIRYCMHLSTLMVSTHASILLLDTPIALLSILVGVQSFNSKHPRQLHGKLVQSLIYAISLAIYKRVETLYLYLAKVLFLFPELILSYGFFI